MRFEGGGVEPESEARVEEVTAPDESFWQVYRDTRTEFGEPFDDEVIDQLVARDRDVFFPPVCGSSPARSTARSPGSRP